MSRLCWKKSVTGSGLEKNHQFWSSQCGLYGSVPSGAPSLIPFFYLTVGGEGPAAGAAIRAPLWVVQGLLNLLPLEHWGVVQTGQPGRCQVLVCDIKFCHCFPEAAVVAEAGRLIPSATDGSGGCRCSQCYRELQMIHEPLVMLLHVCAADSR
ncbi:uncharacterized protein LJ206_015055 isoform 1-T1 [Theristicus caerulescens]